MRINQTLLENRIRGVFIAMALGLSTLTAPAFAVPIDAANPTPETGVEAPNPVSVPSEPPAATPEPQQTIARASEAYDRTEGKHLFSFKKRKLNLELILTPVGFAALPRPEAKCTNLIQFLTTRAQENRCRVF